MARLGAWVRDAGVAVCSLIRGQVARSSQVAPDVVVRYKRLLFLELRLAEYVLARLHLVGQLTLIVVDEPHCRVGLVEMRNLLKLPSLR